MPTPAATPPTPYPSTTATAVTNRPFHANRASAPTVVLDLGDTVSLAARLADTQPIDMSGYLA